MATSSQTDLGKAPALTRAELLACAQKAGFTGAGADLAVAIALAESGGHPQAIGDKNAGGSYGLWQVNMRWHPEYASNPSALFDPDACAAAAYKISKGGTDWSPWSTYTNKSYLAYMPKPGGVAT
jgi:Lysozyme like domain